MLLLLIPLVWLAIAAFVVILCRGAAHADSLLASARTPTLADVHIRNGGALTVFGEERADAAPGRRPRWAGGPRARGVRGRGGRCVAGS